MLRARRKVSERAKWTAGGEIDGKHAFRHVTNITEQREYVTPQACRRHGHFRGHHASAVRRGALGDHGERRADSTLAARVPCPTVGTPLLTGTDSSVLIPALRFLRAIDFEKVGVERD